MTGVPNVGRGSESEARASGQARPSEAPGVGPTCSRKPVALNRTRKVALVLVLGPGSLVSVPLGALNCPPASAQELFASVAARPSESGQAGLAVVAKALVAVGAFARALPLAWVVAGSSAASVLRQTSSSLLAWGSASE